MAAGPVSERNQDATIYVGSLDEKVNESLLWELFVQAGPVVNVHMPKDRVTMMHQVRGGEGGNGGWCFSVCDSDLSKKQRYLTLFFGPRF